MEKKLQKLFDYQRFEKNERLEQLIEETESRYEKALSDDDLSLVNAAGESEAIQIGGITGNNDNGTIQNRYNTGEITGYNDNGTINNCSYIGGITGNSDNGTIQNGYNTGGITGNSIGTGGGGGGEGAGGKGTAL